MKKYIPLILLFLIFNQMFSQKNEISFGRYSHSKSKGYIVRINERNDNFCIEIKLADSISYKLNQDRKYLKLKRKLDKMSSGNKKIDIEKLESIALELNDFYEKYTFYKTSVLILDKDTLPGYYLEFEQIINSPISILENKNKNRIVLDGHFLTFIRKTEKENTFTNLNSPNEESNPILMKFLKKTFKIFRDEKKNDFLNKEYTFGM